MQLREPRGAGKVDASYRNAHGKLTPYPALTDALSSQPPPYPSLSEAFTVTPRGGGSVLLRDVPLSTSVSVPLENAGALCVHVEL